MGLSRLFLFFSLGRRFCFCERVIQKHTNLVDFSISFFQAIHYILLTSISSSATVHIYRRAVSFCFRGEESRCVISTTFHRAIQVRVVRYSINYVTRIALFVEITGRAFTSGDIVELVDLIGIRITNRSDQGLFALARFLRLILRRVDAFRTNLLTSVIRVRIRR